MFLRPNCSTPGFSRSAGRDVTASFQALTREHFSPDHAALGSFEQMTLGVPLGFYSLAVGTGHGVYMYSFLLTFVGAGIPVAGGRAGMGSFIEALELHMGDLRPTTVEGMERFGSTWPYSKDAFWKALSEVMATPGARQNVFFERASSPYVGISVNLQEDVAELQAWSIVLAVRPFSCFEEPPHSTERSQRVLELVRAWASWYPAHYAVAHRWPDMELAWAPRLS